MLRLNQGTATAPLGFQRDELLRYKGGHESLLRTATAPAYTRQLVIALSHTVDGLTFAGIDKNFLLHMTQLIAGLMTALRTIVRVGLIVLFVCALLLESLPVTAADVESI